MLTASTDHSTRRLLAAVEAVGVMWLVLLPAMRPLVWSGQPTDVANLFYLVLLAAAITTGLLQRGLTVPPALDRPSSWYRRPLVWGIGFLLFAVIGCWFSPLPAAAWTLTAGWALHMAAPVALWPVIRRYPHAVVAGLVAGLVGEALLLIGQVVIERPQLAEQLANDPALTVEQRVADQYQARIGNWRLEGTFLLANALGTYLVMLVPVVCSVAWRQREQPGSKLWMIGAACAGAVIALGMSGSKAAILALLVALAVTACTWRFSGNVHRRVVGAVALLGGLAMIAVLALPQVRAALLASADVRVD